MYFKSSMTILSHLQFHTGGIISCGLLIVSLLSLSLPSYSAETTSQKIIFGTFGTSKTNEPYGPSAIHKYLFEQIGYEIEFRAIPTKRMPFSLSSGAIDCYPSSKLRRSIEQEHNGDDGFLQVTYPESVTDIYIYYKKSPNWKPTWPPSENFLRNARGVSLTYNYFAFAGFNILRIGDYAAGYKMVNYGRADFWVDNISTRGSLAALVKKESEGYVRAHLTHNPLFLTLVDNERGREIKAQWDKAFQELFSQPDLYKEIYLEHLPGGRSLLIDRYMEYVRDDFSEFQSP